MIFPVPIHGAVQLDSTTVWVRIIKCVNRIIWKTLLDANSLLLTLGVYYWWDCYIPLAMLHSSRTVHPDKCPSFISLVSSQSHGQTCKTSLNVLPSPLWVFRPVIIIASILGGLPQETTFSETFDLNHIFHLNGLTCEYLQACLMYNRSHLWVSGAFFCSVRF